VTGFLFAGSGGQGVLFSGRVLAECAMAAGFQVTWFPSYGAEMRGGTANCTVAVSDGFIGSPVLREFDALVALNAQSLERFLPRVKHGGLVVYESDGVTAPEPGGRRVHGIQAARLAAEAGDRRVANMAALGALLALWPLVPMADALKSMAMVLAERSAALGMNQYKARSINTGAVMKGWQSIADQKSADL